MNIQKLSEIFEDLEDNEDKLNNWERTFTSDIKARLESDDTYILSDNQQQKLLQIHTKATQ